MLGGSTAAGPSTAMSPRLWNPEQLDATAGLYRILSDYLRSSTGEKNLYADSWSYFLMMK
jgi:hypothetical protein